MRMLYGELVVDVDNFFDYVAICRQLHRRVVLTVSVCPYFRRRSVLRYLRRWSSVAPAAVCHHVGRWSQCLAVESPSRSPPRKPQSDCTASVVRVPTSSQLLVGSVIVAQISHPSERLGHTLSVPSSLTSSRRHRHRRQPA